MTIAVTLEWNCKPDKGPELVEFLKSILPDTRARQGAQVVEMVVDQDNRDHVLVYELWDKKEDQQSYIAWRQERGDVATLVATAGVPPSITYFDIVDPR